MSANELLDFMRDEMANDAANMRMRQAQYDRILAHKNVPVHVLEQTHVNHARQVIQKLETKPGLEMLSTAIRMLLLH